MKTPLNFMSLAALALAGLSCSATAADNYTVFRICEDQHILKTSDGADCGHIEYIVTDPGQQRIVSTVITGGVIGARHICVPFSDFEASGERGYLLRGVTRERIIAAPPIEVDGFRTSLSVEPSFVEKSSTYFHANVSPGEERGRNLRDVPAERQVPAGERTNDARGVVRDAQEQLPPGERGTVRDSQKQLPVGERGDVRDPQKQIAPGERGAVRDAQEQLPPGERGAAKDPQRQLPPEGRTNNPKTAVGDSQENSAPPANGKSRENGNGAQPRSEGKSGATTGDSQTRSKTQTAPKDSESAVQDKPPGTTHRQKNTPNSENANTEKSRAGVGKAVDSEGARSESATTREKKPEGAQKTEPNEDSPKHSKKGEAVKEDKPSARTLTEKGERKEPKADEQR